MHYLHLAVLLQFSNEIKLCIEPRPFTINIVTYVNYKVCIEYLK